MKKVLVIVALCLGAFSQANAQYSPEKGDFAFELGFTPFAAGGDAFKLNEGMLKGRYFLSGKDVLRFKLGLGVDNKTNTETFKDDPLEKDYGYTFEEEKTVTTSTSADFSFMLGYERHLFQKGRFDVYAGLELGYGMTNVSGVSTNVGTSKTYDSDGRLLGYSEWNEKSKYYNRTPDTDQNSSLNYFKANVFAGVDVYVWKNLYLGAEFGFNLKAGSSPLMYYTSESVNTAYKPDGTVYSSTTTKFDGKTNVTEVITSDGRNTETNKFNEAILTEKNSILQLGFYVEPAIRIGWRF